MKHAARFLFTDTDLGHSFDDEYQAMELIGRVVRQEWKLHEHFATGSIGGSANERTSGSEIPKLFHIWRYVYQLDPRTYSVLHSVLDALLNTKPADPPTPTT